jgi:hypothetical protein
MTFNPICADSAKVSNGFRTFRGTKATGDYLARRTAGFRDVLRERFVFAAPPVWIIEILVEDDDTAGLQSIAEQVSTVLVAL